MRYYQVNAHVYVTYGCDLNFMQIELVFYVKLSIYVYCDKSIQSYTYMYVCIELMQYTEYSSGDR